MRRVRKTKNIFIFFLLLALFVMSSGYAIYQKKLDISGITKIDWKEWNIRILSIETVEVSNAIDVATPSFTNTTARFNSKILSVGGFIKYKIVVKNSGTIDGVLGAVNISETESSVITYDIEGALVDDELLVGEETTIYVTATYDSSKVDSATTNTSNVLVNLNYVQLEGYVPSNQTTTDNIVNNEVVSSGDGVYIDEIVEGGHYYKGLGPNNYIDFNDETWRILSINEDGSMRIIYDGIYTTMKFHSSNSGLLNYGNTTIHSYLNNEYYNTVINDTYRPLIIKTTYNTGSTKAGASSANSVTVATSYAEESNSTIEAFVALPYISDYIRGGTACFGDTRWNVVNKDPFPCKDNNWMYITTETYHFINVYSDTRSRYQNTTGAISLYYGTDVRGVRPVVTIRSGLKLKGTGAYDDHFVIVL